MFTVLIQPLLALSRDRNLFTPTFLVADGDQCLILQEIQRWIDNARAWGVVTLSQGFNRFNQLIAVAGVAGQDIQNHQA